MNENDFPNAPSPKAKARLAERGQKELTDYVDRMLFEDVKDPEAPLIQQFREMEPLLLQRVGIKGGMFTATPYNFSTDSILSEISTWSGLAADDMCAKIRPDAPAALAGREYIGKVIASYVLKKVADVANMTPEYLQTLPYSLFLQVPAILDAQTRPLDGIIGIVLRAVQTAMQADAPFKPYLKHPPGETVEQLKWACNDARERVRTITATDNSAVAHYLQGGGSVALAKEMLEHETDKDILQKVDDKSDIDAINAHPQARMAYIVHLHELMLELHTRRHFNPKITQQRLDAMEEIASNADTGILGALLQYCKTAPRHAYLDKIKQGRTPVDEFPDPKYVKKHIVSLRSPPPDDKHVRERAFLAVLAEMQGGAGLNDRIWRPLARMLCAQKDERQIDMTGLAFAYSSYVGHGGNEQCLDGMERLSAKVKGTYLIVLSHNAEYAVNNKEWYEQALKQKLLRTPAPKRIAMLDRALKQLDKMREEFE
ncbi:hypothetical protein HY642_03970 [Candidatus Woesearchaeota archaeon]|nr:hypothetical protein [Candidatus Woesearchaeota archaeon]